MYTPELHNLLSQHPIFSQLTQEQLVRLEDSASDVTFDSGQLIFREGEEADSFFLLQQGDVALDIVSPGKGLLRIQSVHAGEILGISWLFEPYHWHFDARALSAVQAKRFNAKAIQTYFEKDHELAYRMVKGFAGLLVERLQATRLQVLDLYGQQR